MAKAFTFQTLDARVLFSASAEVIDGILIIEGTGKNDKISVTQSGESVVVKANKKTLSFPYAGIFGGKVITRSGADDINTTAVAIPFAVSAGAGADRVRTGSGADTVAAGAGKDTVRSGDGPDVIAGGSANDKVSSGEGDDVLIGNSGQDALDGQGGNDRFYLLDSRADAAFGGTGFDEIDGSDDDDSGENIENKIPVANPDSVTIESGKQVVITALANDTDDDELSIVEFTQGRNGSVTLNDDGALVYTPLPGFVGMDSFTYKVDDGFDGTATATVTVEVLGQQENPTLTPPVITPPVITPPVITPPISTPPDDTTPPVTTPPVTPPALPSPTNLTHSYRDYVSDFDPASDDLTRLPRGDGFRIEGNLSSSSQGDVSGLPLRIEFKDDRSPGSWRHLGDATTDSRGKFSFPTSVFSNPNADHVFYRVVFEGTATLGTSTSNEKRLPIG